MTQVSHYVKIALICLALILSGCRSDAGLKPFTSDGCSLFPDRSPISGSDWCECCFVHDIAYWKGGTKAERETADAALRDCVIEKTGNEELAWSMYEGVRMGGSPYFYNWYRWGYGWPYQRKYQALTDTEQKRADDLLAAYFESDRPQVCAVNVE